MELVMVPAYCGKSAGVLIRACRSVSRATRDVGCRAVPFRRMSKSEAAEATMRSVSKGKQSSHTTGSGEADMLSRYPCAKGAQDEPMKRRVFEVKSGWGGEANEGGIPQNATEYELNHG